MKGKIELVGMEFHSFHGCLPEERRDGNLFIVDVCASCDISRAVESDDLADTVDYGAVYDAVAEEMGRPSNLLENVAGRILARLGKDFPELKGIRVTVSKRNPPVAGPAAWSRVTVEQ